MSHLKKKRRLSSDVKDAKVERKQEDVPSGKGVGFRDTYHTLWVDRIHPCSLTELSFHPQITSRLTALAQRGSEMPHLLLYGPEGGGKKTRVRCLLHALFGAEALQTTQQRRELQTGEVMSSTIMRQEEKETAEVAEVDGFPLSSSLTQERKRTAKTKNSGSAKGAAKIKINKVEQNVSDNSSSSDVEHEYENEEEKENATTASNAPKANIATWESHFHVEVNPSDAGSRDTEVVQGLIKQLSDLRPLPRSMFSTPARLSSSSSTAMQFSSSSSSSSSRLVPPPPRMVMSDAFAADAHPLKRDPGYRILVLMDAHKLSAKAQNALRCTMEKASRSCRLILVTSEAGMDLLTDAIVSRCVPIRVPLPSCSEIASFLSDFREDASQSKDLLPFCQEEDCKKIAGLPLQDAERAMCMLQQMCLERRFAPDGGSLTNKSVGQRTSGGVPNASARPVIRTEEEWVGTIVRAITEQQSVQQLQSKIQPLLIQLVEKQWVPPPRLLKTLALQMVEKIALEDERRHRFMQTAAEIEHRLASTDRDHLVHLELFCCICLHFYKEEARLLAAYMSDDS